MGRAASGTGGPRGGAARARLGQGARSPTPRPARPAVLRAAARGHRAALLRGRPPAHGGLRPGAALTAGGGQRPGSEAPRLSAGATGAAHGPGPGSGRAGSR